MKKRLIVAAMVLVVCFYIQVAAAGEQSAKAHPGEKLFTQQCAVCHPQGGNIINPQKNLSKKFLNANTIMTEEDIIKIMRKGAPGMSKFDTATISDEDAKLIAGYILKTFK